MASVMNEHLELPSFAMPDPEGYQAIRHNLVVEWTSPSNIALVKYWGKHGIQLPMNPSISITLKNCYTRTSVELSVRRNDRPWVELWMDNQPSPVFNQRISRYLESLVPIFPFLETSGIVIRTSNTFPHSAGIASSASAMSALALCLGSLDEALRKGMPSDDPIRKASYVARLGSGSASRSVFPHMALWGFHPDIKDSSELFAIPLTDSAPIFQEYRDAVLIVDAGKKSISSSEGHRLMESHPFSSARKKQAGENILLLLQALKTADLELFCSIVELEALTLHGLMMSSTPSFTLLKEGTLRIIQEIRDFRKQTHIPLCFTLDAGPNVHLLYPEKDAVRVEEFIHESLLNHCAERQVILDKAGPGPERII